jgi:nitroreductase
MVAAKHFGVDSHPMSGIDFVGLKTGFALQESEDVVMLLALGYYDPAKPLYPRRARLGYKQIVQEV